MLFVIAIFPELDPPVSKDVSIRLIDANNDTCLIMKDTDMYTFSSTMGQWLPQPKNACWRSGLVIKTRVLDNITATFRVKITGHQLACSTPHIKIMTTYTDLSECGLVSGSYHICKLRDSLNRILEV